MVTARTWAAVRFDHGPSSAPGPGPQSAAWLSQSERSTKSAGTKAGR